MFLLILWPRPYLQADQYTLHSTMFLLILKKKFCFCQFFLPLHSTMFLLIHYPCHGELFFCFSLHSTMFLLIRKWVKLKRASFIALHSTMFLLIPVVYSSLQYRYNLTTFCQSCHFIILYLFLSFWTALIFEIFLISQALSTSWSFYSIWRRQS